MMSYLKAFVISLAALACAWFFLALNVSNYFVEKALDGDAEAVDTALWWDQNYGKALSLKAGEYINAGDNEAAMRYLRRAIQANPADARPLVALAALEYEAGQVGLADQMIEVADRLMPVEPGKPSLPWMR